MGVEVSVISVKRYMQFQFRQEQNRWYQLTWRRKIPAVINKKKSHQIASFQHRRGEIRSSEADCVTSASYDLDQKASHEAKHGVEKSYLAAGGRPKFEPDMRMLHCRDIGTLPFRRINLACKLRRKRAVRNCL